MENKKTEVIRSVADGTTLLYPLEKGDCIDAWRVRASEINAKDGWRHFTIGLNKYSGQVAITAHPKEEQYQ